MLCRKNTWHIQKGEIQMSIIDCPNCDYPGNGKCSDCHGGGKETNVFEALAEAIAGESQDCDTCGGSGECTTCDGKGYVDEDDL